jgi:PAS domain S-box-containing protein
VIDLSQYAFEVLRKDDEFILYRGRSKDDGSSRVLVVSPVTEYPAPEILKWQEHAYCLGEELDPTWAARPMAIARHWDRTVLVLEDPGGEPLDQLRGPAHNASGASDAGGQPLDLGLLLRLAISLSGTIVRLHQRGIIHKDLKPANILVNPAAGRCWLTGFGVASRLPRERQTPEPPEVISGTLAYMAPEQTGRMNRSIDSRSDLYSLGVTLYEMFTGTLPFAASDPIEWVHCHIARQPVSPSERLKEVPATVSAIIMKLLAKTAEERYQTAAGVERDLRRCLTECENGPAGARPYRIEAFPLGEHDISDRILIPEKLYGRANEIDTLLASFDRVVASGRPELVLVSGYSGIGKSSVVNELHKVLVPLRGLFASGKFDQGKRDIPYATLAQAFDGLIRPLLSRTEAEFNQWQSTLREALGPNGQLMVDLVPELELIIGKQLSTPDLPPQDAKARFQLVFRRFVGVFARSEHPLALFLDDLQWLDAATLDFVQDLLTQPDVHHLMLIGAYRDNEVDSAHPLWRKLDAIRQAGARVHEIVLAPLTSEDLGSLLVDSLHCEPERVTPLAHLVDEKTAGNPFFAIQFISTLVDEALLTFDHGVRRWSWDVGLIQGKGYTDNVVDLMVGKLNRLPIETQKTLQEFACLGNRVAISTLSMVHGLVLRSLGDGGLVLSSHGATGSPASPDEGEATEEKLKSDLWEAERLEFIVRSEGCYKFVHDRIQEAAYSLIPPGLRGEAHLRIGTLLADHTPPEKLEEAIFEIVNQLNRGSSLIVSPAGRQRLAELNFIAGKRAKSSTAYSSAVKYLNSGCELLSHHCWKEQYPLAFAIKHCLAECQLLDGNLQAAESLITKLLQHGASNIDRAAAFKLQIDIHIIRSEHVAAIESAIECLALFGINLSPHPSREHLDQAFAEILRKLDGRTIESLVNLPLLADRGVEAAMGILASIYGPAMFTDETLSSLHLCHMVLLTLEYGVTSASAAGFGSFGIVLGHVYGRYTDGLRFAVLARDLAKRHRFIANEAMTLWALEIVSLWTLPVSSAIEAIREAFRTGFEAGDLVMACYACNHLVTDLLLRGDHLDEVWAETERGLAFARRAGFRDVMDVLVGQQRFIQIMRGRTASFSTFNGDDFVEEIYERSLTPDRATTMICWYWIIKGQARFLYGDFQDAERFLRRAEPLLWSSPGHIQLLDYHFYSALTAAALEPGLSAEGAVERRIELTEHCDQLRRWAESCPATFADKYALACAEIARLDDRRDEAMDLYERAIRLANENGFIHAEALANELAGRFYAARGFDKIAHTYLRDARYCYLHWGATGKVLHLEELYPHLRSQEFAAGPLSTMGTPVEHLDIATVVKISQAVSSEMILEKLIDTLMRTAIEHAGAERGLLLLPRDVNQSIEAEAMTSGGTIIVRLREAFTAEAELPESIIHYVMRTRESVLLEDASAENPFSTDTYLRDHSARSILCLPLNNQGMLIGLLYLENNLAPKVFTPGRIAVLKVLASQAAISLENTRLYRDLEMREAKIRRLVDANIMGIVIFSLRGEITEANEAFLRMVGYSREDVVSGHMRWTDLTPVEWHGRDEVAVAELAATGIFQPFEKEFCRKDGSRVPIMIGGAMFEGSNDDGVAFALDLSKQKRAEEALLKAQAELAHVARMTTLGQLTASITHEINQPLAGIVTNANASLRWLAREVPDLAEARDAIHRIVRDGNRANAVIARTRALIKKAPIAKEPLEINDVIQEVLALTQNELQRHHISVRTQFANDLPSVTADKIQLQQVLLNLVVNAIQAMSAVSDGPRELQLASQTIAEIDSQGANESGPRSPAVGPQPAQVSVTIKDSGPGLDPEHLNHLFDPFFSTKPHGLGIGLTITRSIVEAHGGRVSAKANLPRGAVFEFTLPVNAAGVQPSNQAGGSGKKKEGQVY